MAPADLRVFCGTYERVLVGLDVQAQSAELDNGTTAASPPVYSLSLSTAYATHIGCIKSLAVGGPYLASGSTDEAIKLYDLTRRKELGSMHSHEGTITVLRFYAHSYMFSASDDGDIAIYRTKDWEKLKVMKGHRGPVTDLAIHPSGKLALSIGADGTLRMWDLLKGRAAYTTTIRSKADATLAQKRGFRPAAERVFWNGAGDRYAVLFNDRVDVHAVGGGAPSASVHAKNARERFLCAAFDGTMLVVGCEDGAVRVFDVKAEADAVASSDSAVTTAAASATATSAFVQWQAHGSRVRDVAVVDVHNGDRLLVSASSDGHVRLWDMKRIVSGEHQEDASAMMELEPLADHNCGTRLTCLAVYQRDDGAKTNVNAAKEDETSLEEEASVESETAVDAAPATIASPVKKLQSSKKRKADGKQQHTTSTKSTKLAR